MIKLPYGWYLVGCHDGTVEPFFVEVAGDEDGEPSVFHNVCGCLIQEAMEGRDSDWWWRTMAPEFCPSQGTLESIPNLFLELPGR